MIAGIDELATAYDDGDTVDGFPELRSITLRQGRSRSDDGHYVIYEIDEGGRAVYLHHLCHTKMDVHGRLEREFE